MALYEQSRQRQHDREMEKQAKRLADAADRQARNSGGGSSRGGCASMVLLLVPAGILGLCAATIAIHAFGLL